MRSTMDTSRCMNEIEEAKKESIRMLNTLWAGGGFLHKDEHFVFRMSNGYHCFQR